MSLDKRFDIEASTADNEPMLTIKAATISPERMSCVHLAMMLLKYQDTRASHYMKMLRAVLRVLYLAIWTSRSLA